MAALLQNHSDEIPQGMPGIISDLTDMAARLQKWLQSPTLALDPLEVARLCDEIQDQAGCLYERATRAAGMRTSPAPSPLVVSMESPGVPG